MLNFTGKYILGEYLQTNTYMQKILIPLFHEQSFVAVPLNECEPTYLDIPKAVYIFQRKFVTDGGKTVFEYKYNGIQQ